MFLRQGTSVHVGPSPRQPTHYHGWAFYGTMPAVAGTRPSKPAAKNAPGATERGCVLATPLRGPSTYFLIEPSVAHTLWAAVAEPDVLTTTPLLDNRAIRDAPVETWGPREPWRWRTPPASASSPAFQRAGVTARRPRRPSVCRPSRPEPSNYLDADHATRQPCSCSSW